MEWNHFCYLKLGEFVAKKQSEFRVYLTAVFQAIQNSTCFCPKWVFFYFIS